MAGTGAGETSTGSWFEIPTPNLTKILDAQEFSEQSQRWIFVMIGKCLHWVNEREEWQVIPFFKGKAGTGKSTILKVIASFYEPVDVGILSSNIEKKFGLGTVYNKYQFICYEVKRDFGMSQAEFQQVVSGERMSLAIKHKPAKNVDWRVVGALAGNEIPSWIDSSGSLVRRIVTFEFNKTIADKDADMLLTKKLSIELPRILVKANRAYLAAVKEFGKGTIWNSLPPEICRSKDKLKEEANIMESFLNSDEVQIGPDQYMPLADLGAAVFQHCKIMGFPPPKITEDLYSLSFETRRIMVEDVRTEREYPPNKKIRRRAKYIIGLDIIHRSQNNNQDGFSASGGAPPHTSGSASGMGGAGGGYSSGFLGRNTE